MSYMQDVPTFETKRLMLRELRITDAPAYQKHFKDYDVIQYLSARVPWPYPDDGAESFIKDVVLPNQGKTRWDWGIFLKDRPEEIIGSIGIFHPGIPENRGFWLGKEFWGKGIMTEAVKPIISFAFDHLKLESLLFANAAQNSRSRRVKEKTGASFVEVRPAEYVNPKYTHAEYWRLTKADWQNYLDSKT